jgi:hypothetical protein
MPLVQRSEFAPDAEPLPEFGLFVLWSRSRSIQDRILADLQSRFEVRDVREIRWSEDRVSLNFGRFYRGRLMFPYRRSLEIQKGRGPFLVVTLVDAEPRYEERETLNGRRVVNANVFDAKQCYREWTGGGMQVHATDTVAEATRDLAMLLGLDPHSHLAAHPDAWDGSFPPPQTRDIVGADGWRSMADLLRVLNLTAPYVVLRGAERLPDGAGTDGDPIQLLTNAYWELLSVTRAQPVHGQIPSSGGDFLIRIGDEDVRFGLRFVGDGFLDPGWAADILENRTWNARGFFQPRPQDAFEAFAYQSLLHRPEVPMADREQLSVRAGELGLEGWCADALADRGRVRGLLDGIVRAQGRRFTVPRDATVFFDFAAAGMSRPRLRRARAALASLATRVRLRALRPILILRLTVTDALGRHAPALRRLIRGSRPKPKDNTFQDQRLPRDFRQHRTAAAKHDTAR